MAGLLGLAIFVLIKAEDVLGFHIVTDLSNDNPTAVHFSILLVSNSATCHATNTEQLSASVLLKKKLPFLCNRGEW